MPGVESETVNARIQWEIAMTRPASRSTFTSTGSSWGASFALICALTLFATQLTQAQTFTVLHNFTGGADGGGPNGLSGDGNGNFYGTTAGSNPGRGIVYRFSHVGSSWILTPLYRFQGGADGEVPNATVTVAGDGTLYGTTTAGGGGPCNWNGFVGCGTIFHLRPQPTRCAVVSCAWNETILYAFQGAGSDLQFPFAEVTFDPAGALYGTASDEGSGARGGVYKLTPAHGGWTYAVIHKFGGANDGALPYDAVALDQAGNVYGTAEYGGMFPNNGMVFELSPSGSGWSETALYNFRGQLDGSQPYSGLTFDSAGNLYGTTTAGGQLNSGAVFEFAPAQGGFTYSVLYNGFDSATQSGGGPQSKLVMDQAGNLYGTQNQGGSFDEFGGLIFKLTPTQNGWIFTDLHDFTQVDGQSPSGNLVLDSDGNLYGTTQVGGTFGEGVIWEITP